MEKDHILNRFIRELRECHKRGFTADFPVSEAQYDINEKEVSIYYQIIMVKEKTIIALNPFTKKFYYWRSSNG